MFSQKHLTPVFTINKRYTQPTTQKGTRHAPPQKIRQEWLALDEAAEVIRKHNITLLPAGLIRHALHGDQPLSIHFPSPVLLRLLPRLQLCLTMPNMAIEDDGELVAVDARSEYAADHQLYLEFAVKLPGMLDC